MTYCTTLRGNAIQARMESLKVKPNLAAQGDGVGGWGEEDVRLRRKVDYLFGSTWE